MKKCQIREKHAHRIFVNLVSYVRLESCGETSNCPNCRFYIRRRLQREEDALHTRGYTRIHTIHIHRTHVWHKYILPYVHVTAPTSTPPYRRHIYIFTRVLRGEGREIRASIFSVHRGACSARETFFHARTFALTRRRGVSLQGVSEQVPIPSRQVFEFFFFFYNPNSNTIIFQNYAPVT